MDYFRKKKLQIIEYVSLLNHVADYFSEIGFMFFFNCRRLQAIMLEPDIHHHHHHTLYIQLLSTGMTVAIHTRLSYNTNLAEY